MTESRKSSPEPSTGTRKDAVPQDAPDPAKDPTAGAGGRPSVDDPTSANSGTDGDTDPTAGRSALDRPDER